MPRNGMTDAFATALGAPVVRLALFFEADFATDTLRVWTGSQPIVWAGNTWIGVGQFAGVSTIGQGSSVEARNVQAMLCGIPVALLGEVQAQLRITKPAKLWMALFNEDGSMIPSPLLIYSGRIDQPEIQDDVETATVTINLESVLVDLNRSVYRRYTADDQVMDYPGDTGGRFISGLQKITTQWGRVGAANVN